LETAGAVPSATGSPWYTVHPVETGAVVDVDVVDEDVVDGVEAVAATSPPERSEQARSEQARSPATPQTLRRKDALTA
jgi:hypothetical protein